jgi:hypothetical protein
LRKVSVHVRQARALLVELGRCKDFHELSRFLAGVLARREDAVGNEQTEAAMYSSFLHGALCALLSAKLDQEHLNDVVARVAECVVSDLRAWGVTPETLPPDESAVARSQQKWFVDAAVRLQSRTGKADSGNDRAVSQLERGLRTPRHEQGARPE